MLLHDMHIEYSANSNEINKDSGISSHGIDPVCSENIDITP